MTDDVWIRPEKEKLGEALGVGSWTRVFAYAAVVVSAQILRWSLFVAHGFDLGYYQQGMAALVHYGPWARSLYTGRGVLAENSAWLALALAYPATWLGTGFLFLVESLAIASGYFPLMRLARAWSVPADAASFIGALYLLSPLLIAGNLYDFHMSMLAVPLVLFALAAMAEQRFGWYLAFMALLTGCGSKAAVAVLLVAVIATFRRTGWQWGAVSLIGVLAWMLFGLHLRSGNITQLGWVSIPWAHPAGERAVIYAGWVLAPFVLILGAVGVRWRKFPFSFYGLLALVYLAGNILSTVPAETSPFDQKSALMVPFFLLALLDVAAKHKERWPAKVRAGGVAVMLAMLVVMSYDFYHSAWRVRPANGLALEHALATVSVRHPVYAQNNVLPHLGFTVNQVPFSRLDPSRLAPGSEIVWDTQFSDRTAPASVYRAVAALAANKSRARVIYDQGGVKVLKIVRQP